MSDIEDDSESDLDAEDGNAASNPYTSLLQSLTEAEGSRSKRRKLTHTSDKGNASKGQEAANDLEEDLILEEEDDTSYSGLFLMAVIRPSVIKLFLKEK